MNMTFTILSLGAAYALVAAMAVLLLFSTHAPVVLRGLVTVSVAALMFVTYRGIADLRGLPSDDAPPERFRMYWAEVIEPDKLTKDPGSIFIWLGELDAEWFPIGLPRAHKLPYSTELAVLVGDAQARIKDGEDVAGEVGDTSEISDTAEELASEAAIAAAHEGGTTFALGERYLNFDFGSLSFGTTPAPVTPAKGN